MPYLSASAVVIHYEEALYQVYVVYLYLYASWFQPMVLVSFRHVADAYCVTCYNALYLFLFAIISLCVL